MAVTLSLSGATPANTALDVTVYADTTGDKTADDEETVTITDLGDGSGGFTEGSYTLTNLTVNGEHYWARVEPRTTDGMETPTVDWVDVVVDPATEPIGHKTFRVGPEQVTVPIYPLGEPRPDLFHAVTDQGEIGSANPVKYDNAHDHTSPIRLRKDGQNWMLATEDLLTGPQRTPDPSPETPIDPFDRWCFRFYNGGLACSPFDIVDSSWLDPPSTDRSLYMGWSWGSYRIFSAPGDGLNYYPQAGDTITWHIYTDDEVNCALYFGGYDRGNTYGIYLEENSVWIAARYGWGGYDEIAYKKFNRGMLDDRWTAHKMSWQYHDSTNEVHLHYSIVADDGSTLLDVAGTDSEARHIDGGIGFGIFPGNDEVWINRVHIAEGERHDDSNAT